MKEKIQMSIKEAERLGLMRQIDRKILTVKRASEELGISLRQAKRVRKRYLETGEIGLISRKRGRKNNREIPNEVRNKAVALLSATGMSLH